MAAGAGLAHKDLAAALELAGTLGVDLPLARMTEDRVRRRLRGRRGLMTAPDTRWSARSGC